MIITLYETFVACRLTLETFSLDDFGEIKSKIGSPISQEGKGALQLTAHNGLGPSVLQL